MFYKDFLDYDMQVKEMAKEKGRKEGETIGIKKGLEQGLEQAILASIRAKAPFSLIETIAKEANISPKRLEELVRQVTV